jgi:FkbM family methyltransferase
MANPKSPEDERTDKMKRYIRLFRNVANWWKHFAVKIGVNSEDPVVFNMRNGVTMEVPLILYHEFKEIFLEDCYLQGFKEPLPDAPVLVDIGANAGFFCLFVASMRPNARIVCCEPIPVNFAQLSRNAAINPNLDITALPVGVYGHSGSMKLQLQWEDTLSTAATVLTIDGRIPIEVPCISLQDLLERHNIDRVDLLKLDCEGSEYSILYRCPTEYLKRIVKMAVEVHIGTEPDHNITALSSFLTTRGFQIHTAGHMLWALSLD